MPNCADSPRQRGRNVVMNNGGPLYGMGFLGALVYYVQQAATFWEGLLGIFKAIFWPAMLLYKLLDYLKM